MKQRTSRRPATKPARAKRKNAAPAKPRTTPRPRPTRAAPDDALPPGVYLSINQWAEETRRDRRTVTKLIADRALKPAGLREGFPVYRLRDLIELDLRSPESIDPDRLSPFERAAWYKAERDRLAVNAERGLTIERADHEREMARILKIVRAGLEVVPDEIERDIGAAPAILLKIEQKMDAICERIYQGIIAEDPPEPLEQAPEPTTGQEGH